MTAPPDYVIEAARLAAVQSPCDKSKRGVVLFNHETHAHITGLGKTAHLDLALVSSGFNGPPKPFFCTGTSACRESCAKVCLHAEQRAIMAAPYQGASLELVHVKVVDGIVVPGGGPSCWQCSRLVVEVGLRGVWLYETDDMHPVCPGDRCLMCVGEECNICSAGYEGETCDHDVLDRHKGEPPWKPLGRWIFYSAVDFHRETLRACGIGAAP